jgi:hypothetical protein
MKNTAGQRSIFLTVILTYILITSVTLASNYQTFACKISCLSDTTAGNVSGHTDSNVTRVLLLLWKTMI